MKPGYKTTEFWLSLAGTLISTLGAAGVIGSDEVSGLTAVAKDLVLGVVALVSIAGYIAGRTQLKMKR